MISVSACFCIGPVKGTKHEVVQEQSEPLKDQSLRVASAKKEDVAEIDFEAFAKLKKEIEEDDRILG